VVGITGQDSFFNRVTLGQEVLRVDVLRIESKGVVGLKISSIQRDKDTKIWAVKMR